MSESNDDAGSVGVREDIKQVMLGARIGSEGLKKHFKLPFDAVLVLKSDNLNKT